MISLSYKKGKEKIISENLMKKKVVTREKQKDLPKKPNSTICTNVECKLRKAGCKGFEGCPGYKGR
ncbi:MAG: hypothetical protein A2Y81_07495 [Nitrospirae bacterium RBG_13_43_8]|nr:MAG: hypothetical protein A2Y81_07495 [Nitrospirae bacterium RBG_13_43_8]